MTISSRTASTAAGASTGGAAGAGGASTGGAPGASPTAVLVLQILMSLLVLMVEVEVKDDISYPQCSYEDSGSLSFFLSTKSIVDSLWQ